MSTILKENEFAPKIARMQQIITQRGLDGVLVLSADPHMSEYLPAAFAVRQALSGFSGSAGSLIITPSEAFLLTDGRYFLQAERELAGSGVQLVKNRDFVGFLREKFCSAPSENGKIPAPSENGKIPAPSENLFSAKTPAPSAADASGIKRPKIALEQAVCSQKVFSELAEFAALEDDDFSRAIAGVPQQTFAPIYLAQRRHESAACKLAALRKSLASSDLQPAAHLISSLDDIAYLCNLRGSDIAHNPFFAAYLLLESSRASLFCRCEQLSPPAREYLEHNGICAREYEEAAAAAAAVCGPVAIDAAKTSAKMCGCLRAPVFLPNPSALQKACKSPAEQQDILAAHRDDGAALVRFYRRLERAFAEHSAAAERSATAERATAERSAPALCEADLAQWLVQERAKAPDYRAESFAAIVALGPNAAQPHHQAGRAQLAPGAVLLIDSGAQYERGTTDVTRVVVLPGAPAPEGFCAAYTAVLCAHIGLARAQFPEGLPGPLLDALARAPLWAQGLDYAHGTGHGVGNFLAVHEGPQVLSLHAPASPQTAMRAGMLTSIEPGVYHAGRWGIRLENLYFAQPAQRSEYGEFLAFSPATLYPFEREYIDAAALSAAEREWLNGYHERVLRELSPLLDEAEREWLAAKCARI